MLDVACVLTPSFFFCAFFNLWARADGNGVILGTPQKSTEDAQVDFEDASKSEIPSPHVPAVFNQPPIEEKTEKACEVSKATEKRAVFLGRTPASGASTVDMESEDDTEIGDSEGPELATLQESTEEELVDFEDTSKSESPSPEVAAIFNQPPPIEETPETETPKTAEGRKRAVDSRKRRRAWNTKYNQSPKGKKRYIRYNRSKKGKARTIRYWKKVAERKSRVERDSRNEDSDAKKVETQAATGA